MTENLRQQARELFFRAYAKFDDLNNQLGRTDISPGDLRNIIDGMREAYAAMDRVARYKRAVSVRGKPGT